MKYDSSTRTLRFGSDDELEAFHLQLSELVRGAMVGATRHIEDPRAAKRASSEVMRELAVVMRTLNAVRSELARKSF